MAHRMIYHSLFSQILLVSAILQGFTTTEALPTHNSGLLPGNVCNYPESRLMQLSDGSFTCICDTSRGFCGESAAYCSLVQCGKRILLRNCSCVCPPNTVQTKEGECIEDIMPDCKDGAELHSGGTCHPLVTIATTINKVQHVPITETPVLKPDQPIITLNSVTSSSFSVKVSGVYTGDNDRLPSLSFELFHIVTDTNTLKEQKEIPLTKENKDNNIVTFGKLMADTTYNIKVAVMKSGIKSLPSSLDIRTTEKDKELNWLNKLTYRPLSTGAVLDDDNTQSEAEGRELLAVIIFIGMLPLLIVTTYVIIWCIKGVKAGHNVCSAGNGERGNANIHLLPGDNVSDGNENSEGAENINIGLNEDQHYPAHGNAIAGIHGDAGNTISQNERLYPVLGEVFREDSKITIHPQSSEPEKFGQIDMGSSPTSSLGPLDALDPFRFDDYISIGE